MRGRRASLRRGYLTDATAPALEGILLVFLVIFLNLLRKESVEDLVDQLGGGGLGGALVLLLGGLPDGLPPFRLAWERDSTVLVAQEALPQCPAFQTPSQVFRLTPAAPSPFPRVTPASLMRSLMQGLRKMGCSSLSQPDHNLYLLHHELGMPQGESSVNRFKVEHTRRNSGLWKKQKQKRKFLS